jgi:flagellum-specific ATP synthase
MGSLFDRYENILNLTDPLKYEGSVKRVTGQVIEAVGPVSDLGELCDIYIAGRDPIRAEVIGFKDDAVLLMAYESINGISPGDRIKALGVPVRVHVSEELLGRVINGLGEPIDGGTRIISAQPYPIFRKPINALERPIIDTPLSLGIRAVDACLTLGRGQRVGIFAGSGVGKSTLLGMVARNTEADVNVVGLIGERGREVKEFIENDLGPEGFKRSVVVAATSDDSPLAKIRAAYVATTIAEYFRDQGKDVLLMMDSITRFARAQREIGQAAGEPIGLGGFPPSVFEMLSKILERAGRSPKGSITGIYTILVEADDINDPISDAVRGYLDGHFVLDRALAKMNHYPAIDVLGSISRIMNRVATEKQKEAAAKLREVLATYKEKEDLILVGAYQKGTDPKVDYAIEMRDAVNQFLRQKVEEKSSLTEAIDGLVSLFNRSEKSSFDDNKNSNLQQFNDLLERISHEAI